jgi:hypothetical protein
LLLGEKSYDFELLGCCEEPDDACHPEGYSDGYGDGHCDDDHGRYYRAYALSSGHKGM